MPVSGLKLIFSDSNVKSCFLSLQKTHKRTMALGEMYKWPKGKKGRIAEVLRGSYMSSEESEVESEESGEESDCGVKRQRLYVKTLPWESAELKKVKQELDKKYASSQSKHSQRRVIERVRDTGRLSKRPTPKDCPQWACVEDESDDSD